MKTLETLEKGGKNTENFRYGYAQFGMLRTLHSEEQPGQLNSSVSFLTHLRESCLAQRRADGLWHVPWRRYLLACLHNITRAELLIGAREVTCYPHFQHYASPFRGDQRLGAVLDWPGVEALLLLDSFEPGDRPALWRKVMPMHSSCEFSFKHDQVMSSAGLTANCTVAVLVNVQF
jgi:hypothetical protein